MSVNSKQRDFLFDHYKSLLIILVVLGHSIDLGSSQNFILNWLKWVIFSFHMPAFIFISGYFSKKTYSPRQLVEKLVLPYLQFEILYFFVYTYILHRETKLWILYPKFTLWYLLALICWKILTPFLVRLKGHMLLLVALGLWSGFSGLDDNFLTLPRILVFFPYFVLGYHMERTFISKLRKWIPQKAAIGQALILVAALGWAASNPARKPWILYGRYSYQDIGYSIGYGSLLRIASYILAVYLLFLVFCILPEGKSRFAELGKHTLSIYLFHGLFVAWMEEHWADFSIPYFAELPCILLFSFALVWLLSRPFFDRLIVNRLPLYLSRKQDEKCQR